MEYIGIVIILLFLMLFVISRKNYSKYKNIFSCVAAFILAKLRPERLRKMIGVRLRRTHVMGAEEERERSMEELTKTLSLALMIVVIAGAISSLVLFTGRKRTSEVLERPDVGENEKTVEIELIKEKEIHAGKLSLAAREYSEEEFEKMADMAGSYIKTVYLGDNTDKDNIRNDLYLPERDETGTLEISWKSEEPALVSRYGIVDTANLSEEVEVTLTAEISYGDFVRNIELPVKLVPGVEDMEPADIAMDEIKEKEEGSREISEFRVPETAGDFTVRLKDKSKDRAFLVACMGLIIGTFFIYYRGNKLGEAGKKRDMFLMDSYYSFINKLTLRLSSGMNLRSALAIMVEDERRSGYGKDGLLYDEVAVALNDIANGISEEDAYTSLGKRIGIPEYIRTMSLIEQNLHHGNKDLIKLLEEEERKAKFHNKERIRKRGEEASEKLLFPMLILLMVVIGIVVYPAFISM